jgi:hypothetical protein
MKAALTTRRKAGKFALLLLALAFPAAAQEVVKPVEPFYLLPQTVYVGDSGRLVLPLGATFSGVQGLVLDRPEQLPKARDLVISRVEIENNRERARLLVDFIAYVPGTIQFPPIKIGAFVFPGFEVRIASILDTEESGNSRVLSPYALPVPVPGTMGMIYALALGIFVLVLGSAAVGIWGLPWFRAYCQSLQKRRMIRGLFRTVKHLRIMLAKDTEAGGAVLDTLNGELRRFLEVFTRQPCFSMVPREFLSLTWPDGEYGGPFLSELFGRCDSIRFGNAPADNAEVLTILKEVQGFAGACVKEGGAA